MKRLLKGLMLPLAVFVPASLGALLLMWSELAFCVLLTAGVFGLLWYLGYVAEGKIR